jgi:GNAT superfamily N-acetyltransferase
MQIPVMTEELAARLERSEVGFWTSRLASVRRHEDNPLGVEIRQFGGVTAFIVQTLPHPMLNRVIGLTPGDEDVIEDVLSWYRDHGVRCRVDITPFAYSQDLLAHLAERGLYPSGFQTVLYGVPRAGADSPAGEVIVQRLDLADRDLFIDLRLRMSAVSKADRAFWKGITEAEYSDAGWRCYVASVDGQPAGMGALYVRDGVGSLAADGTLVEYRGRGCQSALLRARIADAAAAGCELVAAQAEPGSVSQRNIERAGLRTAYTRAIWTDRVREDAR